MPRDAPSQPFHPTKAAVNSTTDIAPPSRCLRLAGPSLTSRSCSTSTARPSTAGVSATTSTARSPAGSANSGPSCHDASAEWSILRWTKSSVSSATGTTGPASAQPTPSSVSPASQSASKTPTRTTKMSNAMNPSLLAILSPLLVPPPRIERLHQLRQVIPLTRHPLHPKPLRLVVRTAIRPEQQVHQRGNVRVVPGVAVAIVMPVM